MFSSTCLCHAIGCVIREQLVTLVASYVKPLSRHPHEVFLFFEYKGTVAPSTPFAVGTMLCSTVCRGCCNGEPSHRKDSAWAWIVCFAAATNLAFSSGLVYSFGVLLPVFMDYFEESRETTGRLLNCEQLQGQPVNTQTHLIHILLVLCAAIT